MTEQEFKEKEIWNDGYATGKREQYDKVIAIIDEFAEDQLGRIILSKEDELGRIILSKRMLKDIIDEDFGWK